MKILVISSKERVVMGLIFWGQKLEMGVDKFASFEFQKMSADIMGPFFVSFFRIPKDVS